MAIFSLERIAADELSSSLKSLSIGAYEGNARARPGAASVRTE